jgi:hypothetical protein
LPGRNRRPWRRPRCEALVQVVALSHELATEQAWSAARRPGPCT